MPNYHKIDVNKIRTIAEDYVVIGQQDKIDALRSNYGGFVLKLYNVVYEMDFESSFPDITLQDPSQKGYVITEDGLVEWFNIYREYYYKITSKPYYSQTKYIGREVAMPGKYKIKVICVNYACQEEPGNVLKITEKDLFVYKEDEGSYVALTSVADVYVLKDRIVIENNSSIGSIYVKINDKFYRTAIYVPFYGNRINKTIIPYGTCFKIVELERIQKTYFACLEP